MASNSHSIVICTGALRQDTCNMWRGLPRGDEAYDNSPVEITPAPGTGFHKRGCALAATVAASSTPWTVAPTHWLVSAWEVPEFDTLLSQLKAGGQETLTTRDWAPFNLTRNRAIAAAQALYYRTMHWDPVTGDAARLVLQAENLAAALGQYPGGALALIPDKPTL